MVPPSSKRDVAVSGHACSACGSGLTPDLLRCETRANAGMRKRTRAGAPRRSVGAPLGSVLALRRKRTRLRPLCLARYSAASARAIRASIGIVGIVGGGGTDADRGADRRGPPIIGARVFKRWRGRARRSCWRLSRPPGTIAMNSSPPNLPMMSLRRVLGRVTRANNRSTSSPAEWPNRSLIDLK